MTASQPADLPRHPIQIVARRTGLSSDLLRAWERRYEAVTPARTDTGRRLYSDLDIERLVMLRSVTSSGRPIRQVAELSRSELQALMEEDTASMAAPPPPAPRPAPASGPAATDAEAFLARGLAAVESMDPVALRAVLDAAALTLGRRPLITDLAIPFISAIGTRWQEGRLRVGHEHLATSVIEAFFKEMLRLGQPGAGGHTMVLATPTGQRHQLGALLAASEAVALGWRPVYLGAEVPAPDLAEAVRQTGASVLGLSIVYPGDDALLSGELHTLRNLLPPNTMIVAGGRAAEAYQDVLEEIGAVVVEHVQELGDHLAEVVAGSTLR